MTAIPARVAGVRRGDRRVPAAGAVVLAAAAEAGVDAAVPRRRRARGGRARLRHGDDSARGQDRRARQPRTWPRPRRWCRPTAPSTSTPGRARSSSSRTTAPAWVAADLIAQAEHDVGRPRDPAHREQALRRAGRTARSRAGARGRARRATSLARTAPSSSPGTSAEAIGARQPPRARAPGVRRRGVAVR